MKLVCELINEDKMVVVSIYVHQSLTCNMLQKDSCKQTLTLFFNISHVFACKGLVKIRFLFHTLQIRICMFSHGTTNNSLENPHGIVTIAAEAWCQVYLA